MEQESKLNIILVGAGGHAKSCVDVIEQTGKYVIKGFLDVADRVGEEVLGYPILDTDENCAKYFSETTYFLITVGHVTRSDLRQKIYKKLSSTGAKFAKIVSPLAYVAKSATIGEGTIVMHHALINAEAVIEENCIVNSKALIEHDSKLKAHSHVSTGAIVNGGVEIGINSCIGSNATIIQGVKLPDASFIKAGERVHV